MGVAVGEPLGVVKGVWLGKRVGVASPPSTVTEANGVIVFVAAGTDVASSGTAGSVGVESVSEVSTTTVVAKSSCSTGCSTVGAGKSPAGVGC